MKERLPKASEARADPFRLKVTDEYDGYEKPPQEPKSHLTAVRSAEGENAELLWRGFLQIPVVASR